MPSTRQDLRTRAVELGLYLPLGAYARLRDEIADLDRKSIRKLVDDLTDRGQERIQPLEQSLRSRATRIRRDTKTTARRAENEVGKATSRVKKTTRKTTKRATAATRQAAPKLPRVAAPRSASDLPIAGYDTLTADEIVGRLAGLVQTDLAKVYKYERANENRSTILQSIESKLVDLPIAGYDALTVDEVTSRLEGLSPEELRAVRRYESQTRDRTGVIDRIDALLA